METGLRLSSVNQWTVLALPKTSKGNCFVLLIGDYFTLWMEVFPLKGHRAEILAQRFVILCSL